jgi:hypothetical protein
VYDHPPVEERETLVDVVGDDVDAAAHVASRAVSRVRKRRASDRARRGRALPRAPAP